MRGVSIVPVAREKGIALILVLWVMNILMAIVVAFSFMTRVNTFSTLSYKKGMERKFLAEAGVESGIAELLYSRYLKEESTADGLEAWSADGTFHDVETEGGRFSVSVRDETGKVDINFVPDIILKNLLLNLGVEAGKADIIVDSVMDWKDGDDLYRLNGAETSYYTSLPDPYEAKNGNFETVEELLLVRGVTPELLYGVEGGKGLIEFLTVNSLGSSINVNSAAKEVLMSLPASTPDIAENIFGYRQAKPVGNLDELSVFFGDSFVAFSEYATVEASNTYSLNSIGFDRDGKAAYPINAVVRLDGDKFKYVSYKSPGVSGL
jgi:general secretion pathway protein K